MSIRNMPEGFGGTAWSNQDVAHPLGLAALVICAIAILMQSRQRVVLPLIFFMIAIPSAQRVVIATIDFSFIRILLLFTLARIFLRKEGRNLKMDKPDSTLMLWMIWGIFAYGVLLGGMAGVITRTGYMLEVVGAYYIGRVYMRTSDDIRRVSLMLGMMAIPMVFFFFIERTTGKNIFSVFGGVPENTVIRNGRLRCQGPFSHPIMAGVFWAGLLPWLGGIWFGSGISKLQVGIFITCVGFIVVNTASSTPVMAVFFGILGFFMFFARYKIPLIRRCFLVLLITLHIIMDAPVWHLISRIDISGGSTGWHRYNLIQQSINHIDEWWLVGTKSTAHWGWGLQDITNQYILEGVRGGLLEMFLFIVFIGRIFALLGKGLRLSTSKAETWILWSSGVMLFVHVMSFFAISYFGQVTSAFFLFMGATVSVANTNVNAKPEIK